MLNKLSPFLFISRFTLSVVYEKKIFAYKTTNLLYSFFNIFFYNEHPSPTRQRISIIFPICDFPHFYSCALLCPSLSSSRFDYYNFQIIFSLPLHPHSDGVNESYKGSYVYVEAFSISVPFPLTVTV